MTESEVKALVRQRDGYRCTECGITNDDHLRTHGCSLHVHRLNPGTAYTINGCVSLCYSCHGPKPRKPRGFIDTGGRIRESFHLTEALLRGLMKYLNLKKP